MNAEIVLEPSEASIVVECELPDAREKVWRALTVPEIVAEWLDGDALSSCTDRPSVDQPGADQRAADVPGKGAAQMEYELVSADPLRHLQYRLKEGEGLAVESLVTFELSDAAGGGTHLRIVHDHFELADAVVPGVLYATAFARSPLPLTSTLRRRTSRALKMQARSRRRHGGSGMALTMRLAA